jgi:hypothetical protein
LTSIIAVNALIRSSTANSELSVLSGRGQETEGRKKLKGRRGDRGMERSGYQGIRIPGNERIERRENMEMGRYGDEETLR